MLGDDACESSRAVAKFSRRSAFNYFRKVCVEKMGKEMGRSVSKLFALGFANMIMAHSTDGISEFVCSPGYETHRTIIEAEWAINYGHSLADPSNPRSTDITPVERLSLRVVMPRGLHAAISRVLEKKKKKKRKAQATR